MNSEKTNTLKSEPNVSNYVLAELKVTGFEPLENFTTKVLFDNGNNAIIDNTELSNFDENIYRYYKDFNYYHAEIIEMLQRYVSETEDLQVLKED